MVTETERLRKILLSMQDRIKGLGSTNRNRWFALCDDKTMTVQQFAQKMDKYNVPYQNGDIELIWESVGVTKEQMDYTEFLKFVQADVDEFKPVQPRPAPVPELAPQGQKGGDIYDNFVGYNDFVNRPNPGNLDNYGAGNFGSYGGGYDNYGGYASNAYNNYGPGPYGGGGGAFNSSYGAQPSASGLNSTADQIIRQNLREFVNSCMSVDSMLMGEVSQSGLDSIVAKFGITASTPGYRSLLNVADPKATGLIKYFVLAEAVCSGNISAPIGGKNYSNYDDNYNSMYGSSMGGRAGYDGKSYEPPKPYGDDFSRKYDAPPMPPGRSDFETGAPKSVGNPDPRYGERDTGLSSAPNVSSSKAEETLALISTSIGANYDNSRNAFYKWRGGSEKLSIAELVRCVKRDCKCDVSLDDAKVALSKYGDPLSLNQFITMLSDGADAADSLKQVQKTTRVQKGATEDDQTLIDIARQIGDKPGWENAVYKASTNDRLIGALRNLGVEGVPDESVRRLVSKLGKSGLINGISNRLGKN